MSDRPRTTDRAPESTDFEGKRVLVAGLARSGRAVADFLQKRGTRVMVTDSRPPWTFAAELPALMAANIGVEFGAHRESTFLAQDLIVVSPGVPWDLPQLRAARERRVEVIPEVELASRFLKGPMIGVTGSNGKTTTTTLIGKILEASEIPTFVGGNIGIPLISAVDDLAEESVVVGELSSFQLEAIQQLRPHVAVLLNITPNHLDRHPSFEAYVEAKARIFRNQTPDDYAVLNADDAVVMGLAPRIKSRKVFFSLRQNLPDGLMVSSRQVVYRVNNLERELVATSDVKLRGDFNLENVLAAAAAACVSGADFGAIARAVRDFRGVEHRLEYVRTISGVEFFNDSKATSVDATSKALSAFERGVHLILGGKDKGASYAPIRELLAGRVCETLLIGAAADRIAQELAGAVELVRAGDLETAVRRAFDAAESGDVVLLAPACSSYDQFENFEERGRKFKEIVNALAEETRSAARNAGASGRSWQLEPTTGPAHQDPPTANELSEAGEENGDRTEARASMPQVLGRPELAYVYEVDAQEYAPLDFELEDQSHETLSSSTSRPFELEGGPRAADEDLLIFEVTGAVAHEKCESGSAKDVSAPPRAEQSSFF